MKTISFTIALALANSAAAADFAILHPGSAEGGTGSITVDDDAGTAVIETTRYVTIPYDVLHRDGFDATYRTWTVTTDGTTQTLVCAGSYGTNPGWLFLDC